MNHIIEPIPVMRPRLVSHKNVVKYLSQMDDTRVYTNRGPLVKEFEKRLADYFGVDSEQVVVCANATLGLEGSLVTHSTSFYYAPVYTFPATLLSLINARKAFEILDIQEDNWQLDLKGIKPSPGKGVLVVLPFGSKCDMAKFLGYESVIVDAAASIAQYHGQLNGLPSNFAFVFSLHATKVLGIGEGGVVVFGNRTHAKLFRSWINFGFNGSRDSETVGNNGKMSEISAAYGLATLDSLEIEFMEWRNQRRLADASNKSLGISPSAIAAGIISPYRIVELESPKQKTQVQKKLHSQGIETRDWWGLGCHKMKAFQGVIPAASNFPRADFVATRTLGIPLFRDLSIEQLKFIDLMLEQSL